MNTTSSDDNNDPFAVTEIERPSPFRANIVLVTKTYFYVQGAGDSPSKHYERKWPHEFVFSKNPKFVHVIHCRCLFSNAMVGDVMLHASFVERDNYLDSFICFTNTILTKYKKYEVTRPKETFKIWFTDLNGNLINVQQFVLELMLEY